MNKTITQFRWLVTALMLVAAMVMPFGAWAEENNNVGYAVFNSATGTLTFKYGVKPSAGDNETVYDLNTEENDPGWTTNKSSIKAVVFDETFQDARPTSCYKWFYKCYNLTTITDIQYLNTSEVTSMVYMFLGCTELTSLDLSSFNTQKVNNMNRMFRYCKFTTLDLSSFNTGSVNNMSGMFQECSNLTTLTLPSNFDTSEVTDMSSMFYGCSGLTSLDLSSFNTSKVTEMYNMFNGCSKLTSLDLSNFDTSEVTKMYSMFNGCPNLTSLDLSSFNTSKVTDMSSMFNGCPGLTSLDLSSFDTGSVNDMSAMFSGCSKLNTIYVSDMFTTGNETISEGMFNGCTNLKGAISYDSEKANDKTYANYLTGYFSYGIKTAADLNTFAQYVNGTYTPADGECATVHPTVSAGLMNDITLTAEVSFTPISSYTGTFDGRQHVISGLNFGSDATSLFTYNNGTIKNLGVVADGSNGSICATNSGTISGCFFMGSTTGSSSPSGSVCQTNNGTVTNSYYLSGSDDGNGGKTAAQFASGEVAWLLNGGTTDGTTSAPTDGTQMWYQNITGENANAYPMGTNTGANTVYQVDLYCVDNHLAGKTYANTTEVVSLSHDLICVTEFNSEKKIYEKVCPGEGCGHISYYADKAGEIKATANADETAFTVPSYTLTDATPYDNQCVFTVTDFSYVRTFTSTNWTTWYVPFELALTDDICKKYAFSRINNVHQYDDDSDGNADRTVVESFIQNAGVTLKANYPYLVRAKSEGDLNMELKLTDVKPALAEAESIDCQSVDYKYVFTGTYVEKGESGTATTDPYSLWTDGAWHHFQTLEPMRHYLTIQSRNASSASPASMRSIKLSIVGEEETTGILKIYNDERRASETYDLSGRRLPAGSQHGLVIQNGKIVFKK
ncbi:MAG: BspA family leucine-rich repeat surface protein [Prevotella sp.]